MIQDFILQLDFKIQNTNVRAQKISGTILETYEIIDSTFFILDKDDGIRFFKKSFY